MPSVTQLYPLSHFREIWISSATDFTLAVIITIFGLILMLIYFINRKHSGLYMLYGGLFTFFYGLRILSVNEMVLLLDIVPPLFLRYMTAVITYFVGVFSLLLFVNFIGWGWKRSIFWLLIIQLVYGVIATVVDICMNTPFYSEYPINSILVCSITCLILANIFLSGVKITQELLVLGFGLGIFLLSVLNDNLAELNLLPWSFKIEWPAFVILICSVGYVILRRSIKMEKDLIRVNRDMENARNILSASLPQNIPVSPAFSLAISYHPMDLVGGDFYDFYPLENDCLSVLVADVSGHGLPAALIASMLKVAFQSQRENAASPSKLLEGINKILYNQMNDEFITLAYLFLDPKAKIIAYSTAGHPPLLFYQQHTGLVKELKCTGVPVGISPVAEFSTGETGIESGDRIVLYTDGIIEASDKKGILFGKQKLIQCLQEHCTDSPEKLSQAIYNGVTAWSRNGSKNGPDDDMTCIVLDIL